MALLNCSIFAENILNALELVGVPLARGELTIDSSADTYICGYTRSALQLMSAGLGIVRNSVNRCTFGMDCRVTSMDRVGHFCPGAFCVMGTSM
jgi:hypothetical protein